MLKLDRYVVPDKMPGGSGHRPLHRIGRSTRHTPDGGEINLTCIRHVHRFRSIRKARGPSWSSSPLNYDVCPEHLVQAPSMPRCSLGLFLFARSCSVFHLYSAFWTSRYIPLRALPSDRVNQTSWQGHANCDCPRSRVVRRQTWPLEARAAPAGVWRPAILLLCSSSPPLEDTEDATALVRPLDSCQGRDGG